MTTPVVAATDVECCECGEAIDRATRNAYHELYGNGLARLSGLADALTGVLTTDAPPSDTKTALAWAVADWLGHEPEALVAAVRHRLTEEAF